MSGETVRAIVDQLRVARRRIFELASLVIALSLAANLVSSVLFDLWGARLSLFVGLSVMTACFAYYVFTQTRERSYELRIEAAFASDWDNSHKPLALPGYRFSEEFAQILNATLSENAALRNQWESHPLGHSRSTVSHRGTTQDSASFRLVREAAEYVILRELSHHLDRHFNRGHFNPELLVEVTRDQLSDILMSNRVLEMISRDIKDRPGMFDRLDANNGKNYGSAFQYALFRLTLPKGSKLRRLASGALLIDGPALRLEISTAMNGANPYFYPLFVTHVMGREYKDTGRWKIDFRISAKIKKPLVIPASRWPYHSWFESFTQRLEHKFAYKSFFADINWPASEAILAAIFRSQGLEFIPKDMRNRGMDPIGQFDIGD
ncbi:hypothetical protein [Microbispora bryophytorum]|uniref:hypothetical protein n=1 Tax=Microbispora bryophytorum TaxID=1460882 RepID=UPI0033CB94D1